MSLKKNTSLASVALLLVLGTTSKAPLDFLLLNPVLAQSGNTNNTFELPKSVAEGTNVKLDGSESTSAIDKILKQNFEKQFADTKVQVEYGGTEEALQALREGKVDVVGIGRPLTDREKAQGLGEVSLKRHKIAILVGENNPFKGNLTIDQFARIFRGEIRDWSQVGGSPGKIRVIDFPDRNDTRQALQKYPVFKRAPFKTGNNALKLEENKAAVAIDKLGKDGITYVLANRIGDLKGARFVPMHQTTPDDPRYPFSQSLYYVYNQAKPTPAAQAFLGYATAPANQQNLNEQLAAGIVAGAGAIASPGATSTNANGQNGQTPAGTTASGDASNNATPGADAQNGQTPDDTSTNTSGDRDSSTIANASETAPDAGIPPWLWWLLPLLAVGGLGAWLFKKRAGSSGTAGNGVELRGGVIPDAPPPPPSTPTPVASPTRAPESSSTSFADASTIAPPRSPSVSPAAMGAAGAAGLAGLGLAGAAAARFRSNSKAILVPRNDRNAYAYWEIPEEDKQESIRQGGQNLALRLYDSTDVNLEEQQPRLLNQYDCDEDSQDLQIPIPASDRDYLVELGYTKDNDGWLSLAKSAPVRVVSSSPAANTTPEIQPGGTGGIGGAAAAGAAGIAGVAAASAFVSEAKTKLQTSDTRLQPEVPTSETPTKLQTSDTRLQPEVPTSETPTKLQTSDTRLQPEARIAFAPRDSQNIYAFWELPEQQKELAKSEGGEQLMLRLYDVTDLNSDEEPTSIVEEHPCDEMAQDMHLSVPVSDRDYLVELGYTNNDGNWLSLARSTYAHVPATDASTTTTEISTSDRAEVVEEVDSTAPAPTETIDRAELVEEVDSTTPTETKETSDRTNLTGGIAGIAGVAAAASAFVSEAPTKLQSGDTHPQLNSRIVLTARDSQHVYAYWEIPQEQKNAAKSEGGKQLKLRLYEVTNINLDVQPAHSMQEHLCDETTQDMHLSVPVSDRDYLVELGYTNNDGNWLSLARSTHVRVPAADANTTTTEISTSAPVESVEEVDAPTPTETIDRAELIEEVDSSVPTPTEASVPVESVEEVNASASTSTETTKTSDRANLTGMPGIAGVAAAASAFVSEAPTKLQSGDTYPQLESRIVLTARDSQHVYAYWEIPQEQKNAAKSEGGKHLKLRLYDVTNINLDLQPAHSRQDYLCDETTHDMHLSVPVSDRDYLVELGYLTDYGHWLSLARSAYAHVPAAETNAATNNPIEPVTTAQPFISSAPTLLQDSSTKLQPTPRSDRNPNRIIFVPGNDRNAYAYWEIDEQQREEIKRRGGRKLALRLYDVTNLNPDVQEPLVLIQYECGEFVQDFHFEIPRGDRDYRVELGYLTEYERWLSLAKSGTVRIQS
jgi:phosphate transport system substrate-binding protein